MIGSLTRLEADGLIQDEDLLLARDAEFMGSDDFTIGFELEILKSANGDIKETLSNKWYDGFRSFDKASETISSYGYTTSAEGLIEIATPPAKHPLSLVISNIALVNLGYVPQNSRGVVTSHVSISHNKGRIGQDTDTHYRLANILRATELDGGTTPKRLMGPINEITTSPGLRNLYHYVIDAGHYRWNQKGDAGVLTRSPGELKNSMWRGNGQRIEFRTLRYKNPIQQGRTMMALYFLSRGLLDDKDSMAHLRFIDFEDWFNNYRQDNFLPAREDFDVKCSGMRIAGPLSSYLRPYAKHMAEEDTREVREQITDLITDLQEEYDMNVGDFNLV